MDISSCYHIGLIAKPHGLKGEVTVLLDDDIPNDFASIDAVFIESKGQLIPHFIQDVSVSGRKAFVKFEDVNEIAEAEGIAKCHLYLPKAARPKARRGEFYNDEVIGFEVEDEVFGVLGKVVEVVHHGPQRLLSLRNEHSKEILIPIEGPFITNVNKTKKKMSVNLPDGFLEL